MLAMQPHDQVGTFSRFDREGGMVLATQVEDGLARREAGKLDSTRRHLLRLLIDPARAAEGDRTATKSRGAQESIQR